MMILVYCYGCRNALNGGLGRFQQEIGTNGTRYAHTTQATTYIKLFIFKALE